MAKRLDPRIHPYRADLAAAALRGRVRAKRFAAGRGMRCVAPLAPIRETPDRDARQASELLLGEEFEVFKLAGGWAWGQCARDGYVGYVAARALSPRPWSPDHVVAVVRAPVFGGPDFKRPVRALLSLNAAVKVTAEEGDYRRIRGGGWVYAPHLCPVGETAPDYVETAWSFLETPYVWGGNSASGVDCSGLVQASLQRAGIACPRDSDMQEKALGAPVGIDGYAGNERRGDLVFLPGHVGLVAGRGRLLHASSRAMRVVTQPLGEVLARFAAARPQPITAIRRLPAPQA
jgi:hypothetical protein